VAVASLFVPFVERLFRALGSYPPDRYEPKDLTRLQWLARRGVDGLQAHGGEVVVNAVAFVLLGMLWIAILRARR
jgi:hypothetical protein